MRRYSVPLRAGHKAAHLFTETTTYRYIEDPKLSTPKRWFVANVDKILELYGKEHQLQKEDLCLGAFLFFPPPNPPPPFLGKSKVEPNMTFVLMTVSYRHFGSTAVRAVRLACSSGFASPLQRAPSETFFAVGPIHDEHLARRFGARGSG